MSIFNKVQIIGNVVTMPIVISKNKQLQKVELTLGFDAQHTNDNGDFERYNSQIKCVGFGKVAQIMQSYITKGKQIAIEGILLVGTDNNPRVEVKEIILMGA